MPDCAHGSRRRDRSVPLLPGAAPLGGEPRADPGHAHFLAGRRGCRQIEQVFCQAARRGAALFGGALNRRPPGRHQNGRKREYRQPDQRRMDRCQDADGHREAQHPAAGREQRPIHVVEHEHLVAQHAQAIEVVGAFLVLECGGRCLKVRDVRLEGDGDAVAEAALRAIADHTEKPRRGGRDAEPERRRQHQPAPAAVHAVGEQLQPDRQQRVGERGEQRQPERNAHQPWLGVVSALDSPPHRGQRRRQTVSRGHRRMRLRRSRRTAKPGDRTCCDTVRPGPSVRRGCRAR